MSDETPILEDLLSEDEIVIEAETIPIEKPKPKTTRKASVRKAVTDVATAPIKAVEKVVSIVHQAKEEEADKGPDYSYFPDNTCWLCKRESQPGGDVQIIAGNGFFSLFMCAECQIRFRGARPS